MTLALKEIKQSFSLFGCREHILTELENEDRETIIDTLATFPNQLEADDVGDFFSLAQYYASKTPQSFRRVSQIVLQLKPGSYLLRMRLQG